jgi:archaellin
LDLNADFKKNKKGVTGIETAIIVIISFVIAASAFAFAILEKHGLLTTGKAHDK